MVKKFKAKYCRECGEMWMLVWDQDAEKFWNGNFSFFDADYEYHKMFHGTYKLISEIKSLIGGI